MHTLGMLVPCANTAAEIEVNRVLPKHYQVHVGRLPVGSVDAAGWRDQDAAIDAQAALLGSIKPAAVILLQTSASFFADGYDAEVARRITDAAGAPGITTAHAMGRALKALGARRVAMVSPYQRDILERGKHYFESVHGLEVVAMEGFDMTDPMAIRALGPEVATAAFERADSPEVEALIMAGGAFRALDHIAGWEQRFGKPVVTTNQVAMWAAVQAAGGDDRIQGHGRLLAQMPTG